MDSGQIKNLFRAEMFDLEEPYLWSDSLIYGFIDDAQKMFCRWTEGIEDGVSFRLALIPGVEWYAYSPLILKFRRAVDAVTRREIATINPEKLGLLGSRFYGYPGAPFALVYGIQKGMVQALPVPREVGEIRLEVFRLPKPLEPGDELEIDEHHHRHLLLWVKALAYNVQDADTFDRRKSDDFEQRFEAYCERARREQERARRVVGTVNYGGL